MHRPGEASQLLYRERMASMPFNYPKYPNDPAGELAIALDAKARRLSGGAVALQMSEPRRWAIPDVQTIAKDFVVWICRAGCSQDAVTEAIRRRGVVPEVTTSVPGA